MFLYDFCQNEKKQLFNSLEQLTWCSGYLTKGPQQCNKCSQADQILLVVLPSRMMLKHCGCVSCERVYLDRFGSTSASVPHREVHASKCCSSSTATVWHPIAQPLSFDCDAFSARAVLSYKWGRWRTLRYIGKHLPVDSNPTIMWPDLDGVLLPDLGQNLIRRVLDLGSWLQRWGLKTPCLKPLLLLHDKRAIHGHGAWMYCGRRTCMHYGHSRCTYYTAIVHACTMAAEHAYTLATVHSPRNQGVWGAAGPPMIRW